MSLVRSARINGRDPYGYLKDVLERLPLQPASRMQDLLPHRWRRGAPEVDCAALKTVRRTHPH